MGPRFSVALFFAVFVLFPTRVGAVPAQESSAKSAAPTTASAKASEKDSNSLEAYVFELIQTRIAFEADGKGYRDFIARVHIKSR